MTKLIRGFFLVGGILLLLGIVGAVMDLSGSDTEEEPTLSAPVTSIELTTAVPPSSAPPSSAPPTTVAPTTAVPATAATTARASVDCTAYVSRLVSIASDAGELLGDAEVASVGAATGVFTFDEVAVLYKSLADDFSDLRFRIDALGEPPPQLRASTTRFAEAIAVFVDAFLTGAAGASAADVDILLEAAAEIERGGALVSEATDLLQAC